MHIHFFFGHGFFSLFVIQTTEGRKNLENIHECIHVDVPEILHFAMLRSE